MANKKKNTKENQENKRGSEIWGVIFLALALLIFIAIISYNINNFENILGPIFGTYLASGLVYLFGSLPVYLFPAMVAYTGVLLFKGTSPTYRHILFWGLLTLELCVLLTLHNLPATTLGNFTFHDNFFGNAFTYLLHFVFGKHTFGPYFLVSLALVLTLCAMFNVDIGMAIRTAIRVAKEMGHSLLEVLSKLKPPKKEKVDSSIPEETVVEKIEQQPKKEPLSKTKEGQEPETEQPNKPIDEELAAFRAKRDLPITISTEEIAEEEEEEELEIAEDASIEEAAHIDPSLIDTEDNEDEFCKVPTLEENKKPKKPKKPYEVPSPDILPEPPTITNVIDRELFEQNSKVLEKTLLNFGVEGKVINICPGPVVTRYEIELAPGVKISKVVNLHDDLSMAVGGKKIRIQAPIPGKVAVGIELPNDELQIVNFKSILISETFQKSKAKLPIVVGRSISGAPYVTDIAKMPHVLIAGQTGAGKSVCINSVICSLLMTKTPEELRLVLIDPKKVEMSYYQNIPHLMSPVVTESKEAVKALQWGVMEMTRRYRLLAKVYARNIDSFNQKIEEKSIKEGSISESDNKRLPFIVIIVDELADLMLTASRDVEGLIQRIAQLARAVGIHLIVSTQRPSVDIITGPIKANLTSRIAFRTIQAVDSRTILGYTGAEKLLGRGDMLFLRSGAPDIERYHGAFISEEEVENIVDTIKNQEYETEIIESFDEATSDSTEKIPGVSTSSDNDRDEKFEEAARLIVSTGLGSTSLLQRRLKLGYARAGRLMDELHQAGVVGPQEGSKAREVLINSEVLEDMLNT